MKNRAVWKAWSVIGVFSMTMGLSGCQNTLLSGKTGGSLSADALASTSSERTEVLASDGAWLEAVDVKVDEVRLKVDDTSQLEVELKGQDSAVYRLQYHSSDEAVCAVTAGGVLKALEPGEVTITIEDLFSGLKSEVKVIVNNSIQPEQIQFEKEELSIAIGDVSELQLTLIPEDADKELLIWKSSDDTVVAVNEKGEITGLASGECKIVAVLNGHEEITAEIKIIVTDETSHENSASSNAEGSDNHTGSSDADTGNIDSGNSSTGSGSSGNGNNSAESGNDGTGSSNAESGSNGTESSNAGGSSASENNNASSETSNGGESVTTESTTEAPASGYYVDAYAEQVLAIVNARRSEAGLTPLTMNYTLVSAAKVRATETVQLFSHTRPNGTSCFTAIDEAGVGYMGAGENIAAGQASPDSVMNAWMNSEGHRANIMDGSFTQIGIACYYDPNSTYGYYWVQCFVY